MKKLLAALLKAGLLRWLITAIGIAFLLVLLRAAGIDVGRYADQLIKELRPEVPIAKTLLVGGLIGVLCGSSVAYFAIRLSLLMGYPRTRETNLKILVVAIPVVFVGNDLGFLLSEPLGGQRDDRELP